MTDAIGQPLFKYQVSTTGETFATFEHGTDRSKTLSEQIELDIECSDIGLGEGKRKISIPKDLLAALAQDLVVDSIVVVKKSANYDSSAGAISYRICRWINGKFFCY